MTLLHALILGIIEGITEFLPISSTGHMILASQLLGLAQSNFVKSFEIVIQLGSIAAVMVLYWRRLLTEWETVKRVAVAFFPTATLGLLFYKIIKQYLLGNSLVVVAALIIGGIFLIAFEKLFREKSHAISKVTDISYSKAFLIGVVQCFAFVPGVSRSAATILGGMALNISRITIVEMSFLLAVPTMAAATGLDLVKNYHTFHSDQVVLLSIGFLASFVTAYFAIKFLLQFIQKHSFVGFGIYRIFIGLLFLLVF